MASTEYRRLMQDLLDEDLFRHSLGVADAAAVLAVRYGVDVQKAYLSGIVHDYGKRYNIAQLLEKASSLNLALDRYTKQEFRLLHAPVGAALLGAELGIKDPEVLAAVRYHTTGRAAMKKLEKVVYLADYIEKGRVFHGVEEIRDAAIYSIDRALLLSVDNAIKSVLKRALILHPRSVAFRNALLADLKR